VRKGEAAVGEGSAEQGINRTWYCRCDLTDSEDEIEDRGRVRLGERLRGRRNQSTKSDFSP
jgi:hypothetical protein